MDEWMLYQIGSKERNKYRYLITKGFNDDAVAARLGEGGFIDCVVTLSGMLGADVDVVLNVCSVPRCPAPRNP